MTSREMAETLEAKGTSVRVVSTDHGDYLSLTVRGQSMGSVGRTMCVEGVGA